MAAELQITDEMIRDVYRRRMLATRLEADLLDFSKYFFRIREAAEFRVNWHHVVICEALEKVHAGLIRNLIINVPPGSSKTELAVINFMAWSLAKNDRCRFLHVSYADTLVKENSSKTKELVESEEFQTLWPMKIAKDSKAKDRWNILIDGRKAGGCYAVPLGGTITGFRAGHMTDGFQGAILIDDPVKPEDAFSETRMAAKNRQLENTVRSRKARPETPVILIMQRVGLGDPTDFALDGKIGGLQFEQIKIPALNEDGSSYWEFKEPAHELIEWQKANPYTFSSQLQQEPTVLGGSMFKSDWWQYWTELPEILMIKIYGDTAMKKNEWNDYSVFQAWGLGIDQRIYLLDQVRGKWEAPELEIQARAFWAKWRSKPLGRDSVGAAEMLIEDKASGTGLIQTLSRPSGGNPPIPVSGIERGPEANKVIRANSSAPQIKAGLVMLPDPDEQPTEFLTDYLAEFAAFNAQMTHKHDDQVDPTMDAIHDMLIDGADFYAGAL